MPQLNAAKKALRVSDRRRAENDRWRQRVRAASRALKDAIQAKDKSSAETLFVKIQKILDRTARRNIIHKNKAARRKSRFSQAIAKL